MAQLVPLDRQDLQVLLALQQLLAQLGQQVHKV
jgi:hypothetical protein